jgi:glutathione-regulated potassium-efflux system protein KefB
VRERDRNRLVLQQAEGISAGRDLLRTRMVQEPLSGVARKAKPLNPEAQEIVERPPAAQ